VFNGAHTPSPREALGGARVVSLVGGAFGLGIASPRAGRGADVRHGYLVEQALSVDNLFVFLVLFAYFKVPDAQRHRVLFWGIIGALAMRAVMIFAGRGAARAGSSGCSTCSARSCCSPAGAHGVRRRRPRRPVAQPRCSASCAGSSP
jgi:hypothetical protein